MSAEPLDPDALQGILNSCSGGISGKQLTWGKPDPDSNLQNGQNVQGGTGAEGSAGNSWNRTDAYGDNGNSWSDTGISENRRNPQSSTDGYGDKRKAMLQDIAILTGGEVITSDLGLELKDTKVEQLGRAKQIKVQKENTIIVDGMGDKQQIADRVAQIRAQLNEEKSEFEKENLQERLAKIAGGVAVIGVGAATEIEMKEKKLRIEDALSATKAAVEEGIVAGGGTAYINVMPKVEKAVERLDADEKIGGKIILRALEEPIRQISINAGLEPAIIVNEVKKRETGIGFNAATEEYVDMKKAGIVDPTKVSRSALQNAVSVASMILTTESIVTDKKEEKECNCGHNEPSGMEGMY